MTKVVFNIEIEYDDDRTPSEVIYDEIQRELKDNDWEENITVENM